MVVMWEKQLAEFFGPLGHYHKQPVVVRNHKASTIESPNIPVSPIGWGMIRNCKLELVRRQSSVRKVQYQVKLERQGSSKGDLIKMEEICRRKGTCSSNRWIFNLRRKIGAWLWFWLEVITITVEREERGICGAMSRLPQGTHGQSEWRARLLNQYSEWHIVFYEIHLKDQGVLFWKRKIKANQSFRRSRLCNK